MAEEQNKINTNKNSEEGTDKSNKEDNIDHEPSEESTRKDNMETDRDANDSNAENEEMSDSKLEEPADGNETQEGNDEEGEDEEKSGISASNEDAGDAEEEGSTIEPILDGRNITFQTKNLNQYLLCSICMGYFKDAYTIMECLHTFIVCKSCIFKYFMEHYECPTCGTNLRPFPMQTIRIDRTLQSIVDKIFPSLMQQDIQAEKLFYQKRGLPVPDALLEEENKTVIAPDTPDANNHPPSKRLKKGEAHKRIYNDEVAFELALDENCQDLADMPKLDKPFIRTSAKITVFHLKKFLSKKLNLKTANDVEITYRGEILGSEHSMEYILKTRGGLDSNGKGPVFVYRKKKVEITL